MWVETWIVAITEKRYNDVTLKNNNRQKSSIKIDELMKPVCNSIHSADMRGDTADISV
jgi:hypothetical protein